MYKNNILVLRKDDFSKNIEHIILILSRIFNSILKFNTKECSFGSKIITLLSYIITGGGIKNDLSKVQYIMDLGIPTMKNEVRVIIVTIQ